MATIKINLDIDQVGKLHLSDSEGDYGEDYLTTNVHPGDKLIWQVKNNDLPNLLKITAITNIAAKAGSDNVFSKGPEKNTDTEWEGTINKKNNELESYSISYSLSNGSTCTDDPIIKVKPVE